MMNGLKVVASGGGRALLALTAALAFGSCRAAPFPADVVARYAGGGVVTLAEVQKRIGIEMAGRPARQAGTEEPVEAQRARIARELVAERTWFASMTPERLAGEKALQVRLAALERALLVGFVQSEGLGISSLVADKEARERYAEMAGHLDLPASYTLRHVYVRVDEGSPAADWAAARQEAERIRGLLLAPKADLDAIVKASSDSEDAASGGWIRRLQLDMPNVSRNFQQAVRELEPGEVSAPVETRRGYQVLLLVNRNPSRTLSFDELRDQIVGQIVNERRARRLKEIVGEEQTRDPLTFDIAAFQAGDPQAIVVRGASSHLTRTEVQTLEPQIASTLAEGAPRGPEAIAGTVDALLQNQMLVAYARREGLDRRPEFIAHLEEQRRNAIIDHVGGGLAREKLAALPATAFEQFYEDNKARFATPRKLHLRGLILTYQSEDLYATYSRAEELRHALEGGASLESLIAAQPGLQKTGPDGDFGWVTHEDLAARGRLFHDTIVAAQVGVWLGPVKWEKGYAVVRVEAIAEPTLRPYAEVMKQVRRAYARRNLDEIRAQLEQEAFAASQGELNPALTRDSAAAAPR